MFALKQESDYIFATNGNIEFDGRMLGFQDVVDPVTGEVIYPAEAFIYGGKAQVNLPASLTQQYLRRNGNPEEQFGVNASYQVTEKFGFNGGITWFSEIPVTRVGYLTVPEVSTLSLGMTLGRRRLALAAERLEHDGRDAAAGRATATAPRS